MVALAGAHGRGDRRSGARRAAISRPPAANSASTSARWRGRRGPGSTCSPTRLSAPRSARPAAAIRGRRTAASTCSRRGPTTPSPIRRASGSCCRTCGRCRPGASRPRPPATPRRSTASRTARATPSSATGTARSTSAVTWCVDAESAVKQVRVRLVNRGHRTMQLRLVGVAEWILRRPAQRPQQHPHPAGERARRARAATTAAPRPTTPRRGARDGAVLHAARPLGRLRRRHRLLRPRRRWRGPRRLDLRPARAVRRPRPRRRPRPLRAGERQRLRPVRRAVDAPGRARRRLDRSRLPARLRQPRRLGARARRAGRAGAAAAAPAAGARALGRAARRERRAHARPAVRRARQPLAALPDDRLPPLGPRRLLPGRRRLRLSRPAAGCDGAHLGRAGAAAPADRALGIAPVHRRRRPALVARADRRGRANALLRRPALAAACHARTTSPAPAMRPCSTRACPFLEGAAIPAGAEDAYYTPSVSDETRERLRARRARDRPQPRRRQRTACR